jgi:transcriptional regulator with XRE-family HTH domain
LEIKTVATKPQIFTALRERMKAQKLTYRGLATRIGATEAAIKNLFHAESTSLERLLEITEALGWNLAELAEAARITVPGDFELSEAQEEFFVKNHGHFLFFDALALQGKSLGQIQKENGLDDLSIQRYLDHLEQLSLIAVSSGGSVQLLVRGQLKWRVGGPWFKANYARILQETAQGFAANPNNPERFISFGAFSLPRPDLTRLYGELEALIQRYKQSALIKTIAGRRKAELFVGFNIMVAPGPAPQEREKIPVLHEKKMPGLGGNRSPRKPK